MYRSEKEEESDGKKNGQKKRQKGKEKSHEHRPFNTNTPWNPTDCLSIEIKLYAPFEGFI
jgi:hypothetical protein